jgi:CRISPR-associated protein Cmr2
MAAVQEAGGSIILPDVTDDALMKAIRTPPGGCPAIGSLPNRFKARVPEGFDPKVCRNAIDASWRRLAGRVWERFVEPVAEHGRDTCQATATFTS